MSPPGQVVDLPVGSRRRRRCPAGKQSVAVLDCNLELIALEEYRFHPNHLIWRLNFRSLSSSK
jgi:hypothetical protein